MSSEGGRVIDILDPLKRKNINFKNTVPGKVILPESSIL